MRSMTNEPRAFRLTREQEEARRIRGYGLAIDFLDGYAADARLIDKHAPALFPEKAVLTEGEKGDRRRFGFVEYWGQGTPPKSGLLRYVGDAFFADSRTASFVWQAVIEKIENDAAARA
ncbi:hypothetical protein [Sinorhizobium medicae]|uniref:hypothetical protein n=2 Tax=Sinorhizobium medicae TaxID=110321 RepID=UPI001071F82F|nr:hypothetical protein [Sinorhizobium medicae]